VNAMPAGINETKTAVTIGALRRSAIEKLRAAGIETAELDARILLRNALAIDETKFLSSSNVLIPLEAQVKFERDLSRRTFGEPVARIVGYKEFWSSSFKLSPDTLVPRPETETIVEAALAAFPERDAVLRVLDLGTGSGILLAAILSERPDAAGIGVDHSSGALKVARGNLVSLGLGTRTQFICGDWADALRQSFDLVVANPPYIPSREISRLPREVREHDPRLALDGGEDGLEAYRRIIFQLPGLLVPMGVAILELGIGQESAVASIARDMHLSVDGPARCDLAGIPRALILRLQG
jgi:release factor glutamine methyltransferase